MNLYRKFILKQAGTLIIMVFYLQHINLFERDRDKVRIRFDLIKHPMLDISSINLTAVYRFAYVAYINLPLPCII